MWEVIQINRRKSVFLMAGLALILAALGALIGYFVQPAYPADSVFYGILGAMIIWIIMMLASLAGGEQILLATAGAHEVKKEDAPQLYNIVEEMKIASGLPAMPRVYIIDSPVPNAFAVGLKPERAAVAVTTGLMAKLNRDELQGVLGHEIGHINNRDTLFMTLAGVTVGAVVIIADLFLRGLWFSGGSRRRSSRDSGGQGTIIILIVSIVLAILAPLLAQLLYFATSRKREYLADASSAQYTRYPEGLASALEKISTGQSKNFSKSRTLAPMYIVNPMAAAGGVSGLFSTHPPTEDRIRILRGMAKSSSLRAYEEAYEKVHNNKGVIDSVSLGAAKEQGIRNPSATPADHDPRKGLRQAKDILHKTAGYGLINCACGLTMKIPPNFNRQSVTCPRCGREHNVAAELLAVSEALNHIPDK
ncbi:MAG: M48 family metallopeptidase [Calditrichia bacterium]